MSLLSLTTGSVVPLTKLPLAVAIADPAYGIVGSMVRLDGQGSSDSTDSVARAGNDAVATSPGAIASATGNFSTNDLGRGITLSGPDSGKYVIVNIVSTTQIQVVDAVTNETPLFTGGTNSWVMANTLTYEWAFKETPIGSQVIQEGFRVLNEDGSQVSFSPDIVGDYVVSLTVSNGVFSSTPYEVRASIRSILVPHARGIIPDGKWIWSYIRDVWNQVENREWFETFWSALIQIAGAELLKTYQVDFNKSIRDIQELYQRRWLKYEPKLDIIEADASFYLCGQEAGQQAVSYELGNYGEVVIISADEFLVGVGSVNADVAGKILTITRDPMQPTNVHDYKLQGPNTSKTGYKLAPPSPGYPAPDPVPGKILTGAPFFFTTQSRVWGLTIPPSFDYAKAFSQYPSPIDQFTHLLNQLSGASAASLIKVGDYIHVPSGPNVGLYRIEAISGTYVTVNKTPPSFSNGDILFDVYRGASFYLNTTPKALTDSFSVEYTSSSSLASLAPGRIALFGGQTYSVLRTFVDPNLAIPSVIITTDSNDILYGLERQNWRIPNTLVSETQNFEELGVSTGDLLVFGVLSGEASSEAEVVAQVVGVKGYKLGFVLTDEPLEPGVVPPIPPKSYVEVSSKLGIPTAYVDAQGNLVLTDLMKEIVAYVQSGVFKDQFCNTPLTSSTVFSIQGRTFTVRPKRIIRNHLIPVDQTVASIPMLQEWVVQPTWIQRDGRTYQVKNNIEYEIRGAPLTLVENSDFVVDDTEAFNGELTFESGLTTVVVEDGHFIDLGLKPGDQFVISSPISLSMTYLIVGVLGQNSLMLSLPVPLFPGDPVVTAKVRIIRKRQGKYVRLIPGGFTPKNPAPERFWAEVTLFDNNDTIENNFGILVGLTRDDLLSITEQVNYRQAVAGLMYAYTRGSAINKVRLGAQILLGLPFAESRGIIRSIDPDYRLSPTGIPVQGRMLVEDVDNEGNPLGTLRVYLYPQDQNSVLAGLEVNPATGVEWAEGDIIELFATISKGVEVTDYLSSPGAFSSSTIKLLQEFHSIRMRANDNLFSVQELGLVSKFLKRITPSYIKFIMTSSTEVADDVAVVDALFPKISNANNPFVDNASLGLSSTLMFDNRDWSGMPTTFFGTGVHTIRKTGQSLSTTYNPSIPSTTAIYSPGGFITPQAGEGPVTKPNDYLWIPEGDNQGYYQITAVLNDTTIQVANLPPKGFNTAVQRFSIVRPVRPVLRTGVADTVASNQTVTVDQAGLIDDGVMPGDLLFITYGGTWSLHTIQAVGPITGGPLTKELVVTPAPTQTASGKNYQILRPAFIPSPYTNVNGTLVSNGAGYTSLDQELTALCDPGDELQVQDATKLRLLALDPKNGVFVPVLPAGSYTVQLCKRGKASSAVGWGHIPFFDPYDVADVVLFESKTDAAICALSPVVTLQEWSVSLLFQPFNPAASGVKPGDLLHLLNGANSNVDVGYGLGVYPITAISTSTVTLGVALSSTDPSAWKIVRRR